MNSISQLNLWTLLFFIALWNFKDILGIRTKAITYIFIFLSDRHWIENDFIKVTRYQFNILLSLSIIYEPKFVQEFILIDFPYFACKGLLKSPVLDFCLEILYGLVIFNISKMSNDDISTHQSNLQVLRTSYKQRIVIQIVSWIHEAISNLVILEKKSSTNRY